MGMKNFAVLLVILSCMLSPGSGHATAFRDIDSLASVTFWESSSSPEPSPFTFGVYDSRLLVRLNDPLETGNCDFFGVLGKEFYDVFYSDAQGLLDPDGEYVTVEGLWPYEAPYGGGLNITEIALQFLDGRTEYGNYVASYQTLGNNAVPSSVLYAIDGDLYTSSIMGNTVGQTERMRITLGFLSSSGPPPAVPVPSALLLLGPGLAGIVAYRRMRAAR